MAQMTVAAAMGHEEPDDWRIHVEDTLAAGRGLCQEELTVLLCEQGPARILEMGKWGTRWARDGERFRQAGAPGHSRRRCCYVDFLNTGPAVAATLRHQVSRVPAIRRVSNLAVTEVIVSAGCAAGVVALAVDRGELVTIGAGAVILAAGGLTKLFARNSASTNMAGEAYALGLWAGAELADMEFVQFFPIGHLAPRLVGMDPIMWDPFRYKLGGRLLNGRFEEFIYRYGGTDEGKYTAVRDLASYAIIKEVEAGRGSPHGGAYLDFRHLTDAQLREAAGPVIDRLLANGIDLTRDVVEVGPIAHYHMGGIRVNARMETTVPGLYAAGEAVAGANGANRLSGNAITEALVFGERAGHTAAEHVAARGRSRRDVTAPRAAVDELRILRESATFAGPAPVTLQAELQALMWANVGPFRTCEALAAARARIASLSTDAFPGLRVPARDAFDLDLQDWYELKAMLVVADAVTAAALAREESRGAHQRLDYPGTEPGPPWRQVVRLEDGRVAVRREPVAPLAGRTAAC
jgi:succinate dehydrogenase/fumarate reductase flavoprotein subunit